MGDVSKPRRMRLGEMLVAEGVITPNQLEDALMLQQSLGVRLGEVVIDMQVADEDEVLETLNHQTGLSVVRLDQMEPDPAALERFPADLARKAVALPLALQPGDPPRLETAVRFPLAHDLLEEMEVVSGCRILPVVALDRHLAAAVVRFYPH